MMRRRTYAAVSAALLVSAALATAAVAAVAAYSMLYAETARQIAYGCVLGAAVICFFLLPPDCLVHELGHILCGLCAGMRFPVVRVGRFSCSKRGVRYVFRAQTAGETALSPRGGAHMKGRLFVTALGGAAFNLIYTAVVSALFFVYFPAPAPLFFALFAPLSLYDAAAALLPAETDAGRTDGAVLFGLFNGDAETDVTLRVLTAQGILAKGTYADIPEELLFGAPVVREDSRAFAALLSLQYGYASSRGERERAERALARLSSIAPYLTEEERAFLAKEKDPA